MTFWLVGYTTGLMALNPDTHVFDTAERHIASFSGQYEYNDRYEPAIARQEPVPVDFRGRRALRILIDPMFQGIQAVGDEGQATVTIAADSGEVLAVSQKGGGRQIGFRHGTVLTLGGPVEPRLGNGRHVGIYPPGTRRAA